MQDNKKAAVSAGTLTTADGTIKQTDTTFNYNTACNIFGVMCQLLGEQEGLDLTVKVHKRMAKQAV